MRFRDQRLAGRRRSRLGGGIRQAGMMVATCLLLSVPVAGQHEPTSAEVELTLERLAELKREIDRLIDSLPAGRRGDALRVLAGESPESLPPPQRDDVVDAPQPLLEVAAPLPLPVLVPDDPRSDCRGLDPLDSTGDGVVDGADRYWRHLYLWIDDGDREMDDGEVGSLYEYEIRKLSLDLTGYTTADGLDGQVRSGEHGFELVLELRRQEQAATLVVDLDGLARASGPRLLDAAGRELSGFAALEPGQTLELAGGTAMRLECSD